MIAYRLSVCALVAPLLLAAGGLAASDREMCSNGTGTHDGFFYTFWKSGGEACATLGGKGRYTSRYRLGANENLVTGKGWKTGSATRTIGYRATRFDAGSNSYLALYGWSRNPLIEYYVVDDWGSGFTPPGEGAEALGTVASDGGVYTIYRTQRVRQPSIEGTKTFYQYWSVRTARRADGPDRTITFANHVRAWRDRGMKLGTMNYQVLATEGFGSSGASDITVWQR